MVWRKKKYEDEEDEEDIYSFDRYIEEEFRRFNRLFDEIWRNAMRDLERIERGEWKHTRPFVYGFSVRIGPDGKPQIEEFGNVIRRRVGEEGLEEYREPLTDVIEGDTTVSITVELPGVNKEDIDVEITEETVTIKVETAERKYYKEIKLPCKVKTEGAKASYHNGVLDIVLERQEPKKEKGKKLKIE